MVDPRFNFHHCEPLVTVAGMSADLRTTARLALLVTSMAISLVACSPAQGGTTLAASTAGTGVGLTPLGNANTTVKTQRPEAPSQLMVVNVRVGSHEGFDRVVFDLVGSGEPGWFIDYTNKPSQQGSGTPVTHEGAIALNVNIDGMAYPFELGMEDPRLGRVPGSGNVNEVVSVGTFEGRSQFVIGLQRQTAYSVQVLEEPKRLVVDIVQG